MYIIDINIKPNAFGKGHRLAANTDGIVTVLEETPSEIHTY